MNNAGVMDKGTSWGGIDPWRKVFEVNLFGCVCCCLKVKARLRVVEASSMCSKPSYR